MGKSDPYIFNWYTNCLVQHTNIKQTFNKILVIGQPSHNVFTRQFHYNSIKFLDIQNNWDINSLDDINNLKYICEEYDLILCTRVSYFSEHIGLLVDECRNLLTKKGILLIDSGIGDHWRFDVYRLGWYVDGNPHEYAEYAGKTNFLHSMLWDKEFDDIPLIDAFFKHVQKQEPKYHNTTISKILESECKVTLSPPKDSNVYCISMWPDNPQLYVLYIMGK